MNPENTRQLTPFGLCIVPKNGDSITKFKRDDLLALAREHKIVLLRGFPLLTREKLLQLCSSDPTKELLHWDFGPVMEMKVDDDPKNYLFSTEKVPFHWDGAFHTVPSYLVFNCIEAPLPDCGGETLFCNSQLIWDAANDEQKALWQRLELVYQTEKKAHYGGRIQAPMVQDHPHTGKKILRYAEPVETELNPVTLEVSGMDDISEFIAQMSSLIYSDQYCYQHQWQQGDFLIADNHALIHGRNAFTRNCPRHLRRIQIL